MRKAAFHATAERVRTTAEQAWGQPVAYWYLRRVRLEYDVPGRREDGTFKGRRLVRRFLYNLVRVFSVIVLMMIDGYLGGAGSDYGRTRNGKVSGGADALALPFADALRQGRRHLWLVASNDHFAMCQARENSPIVTLWEAGGEQRPVNRKSFMAVRWPDGSAVTFTDS